jgi:hypothetical protein
LKQVITLILAVSLYVPHLAKLLAYADCSYIVLSSQNPLLCDCNKIVDANMIPFAPDNPDRQKDISLKADWKYVVVTEFSLGIAPATSAVPNAIYTPGTIPLQSLQSVFHPPRA